MKRRTMLGGLGAVGLAGVAGCLGALGLDKHESTPGGVDPGVLEETGYERSGVEELAIEETFELGPYSEEIVVRNYLTEYDKSVGLEPVADQRAAVFVVLTTPKVDVLGQNFNPVEEMDAAELVELVASNYDDMGNVSSDGEETITILGQETTRAQFTAEASFSGTNVDVHLHVSEAVETEDDLVVTIGVYPEELAFREEEHVRQLMGGVTPDLEGEAADGDAGGDGSDESADDGTADDSDAENGDSDASDDGDDGSDSDGTDEGTEGGDSDDGDDEESDGLLGIEV
ncbi:DUF6517 family protein [Halopiger goleimassiliensis]|uniref:DUF6517 family protein n=1 Tax=Halopiger goleimassiliensis TaxID=1293048 RepID=UPI00067795C7|nr:DUF6517 family protein [Halopiger goleimassiliensis]